MSDFAPIALFAYNRPDHTARTLEHLLAAEHAHNSILYIFLDAAKSPAEQPAVNVVKQLVENITGFKAVKIIARNNNLGLKKNIITGVSSIFENYDRVIVLEDDLICSKHFLSYHNNCLKKYSSNKDIQSISGYSPPIDKSTLDDDVFLLQRPTSWGWSTWRDRWQSCDWSKDAIEQTLKNEGNRKIFHTVGTDLYPMLQKSYMNKINSWAVIWAMDHIVKNTYCVYPVRSLIKNIGTDGSGTNFKIKVSKYDVELSHEPIELPEKPKVYPLVAGCYQKLYNISLVRRLINLLKLDLPLLLK